MSNHFREPLQRPLNDYKDLIISQRSKDFLKKVRESCSYNIRVLALAMTEEFCINEKNVLANVSVLCLVSLSQYQVNWSVCIVHHK